MSDTEPTEAGAGAGEKALEVRELDAWVADHVLGWSDFLWAYGGTSAGSVKWHLEPPRNGEDCNVYGYMPHYHMEDDRMEVPHCTTDPAADYEVLKRVRGTWTLAMRYDFADALADLYLSRAEPLVLELSYSEVCLAYEPGDWARAAYAVLKERDKDKAKEGATE